MTTNTRKGIAIFGIEISTRTAFALFAGAVVLALVLTVIPDNPCNLFTIKLPMVGQFCFL